jgi:31-O-methyltransferase
MSRRGSDLRQGIRHSDPSQLLFQIKEVFEERTYLQHGVDAGPGDIVFDVGANVGVAATFFAGECEVAAVHSFEPVAPIFEMLSENVRALETCTPHRFGLSDRPDEVEFIYYPGAAAMSSRYADPERDRQVVRRVLIGTGVDPIEADRRLEGDFDGIMISCEMKTISAFMKEESIERVDLLKIDVEQAEADVLGGISAGDWPRIRQVVAEVHDIEGRLADLTGQLEKKGFRVRVDQEEMMRPTNVNMVYAVRG